MHFSKNPGLYVVLLIASVCLAYAPCFGAGFLSYDDPWLVVNNELFAPQAEGTLHKIFFAFDFQTRYALGAEYLPLRDVLVWLQTRAFGKSAPLMHAVSIGLYVLTCLVFRGYLRRVFGPSLFAEAAAFVFALHPVHVESVAWLAGQKDVLALLFIALSLFFHTEDSPRARVLVPLFVAAACLSKSMSVSVIALLGATDLALKRRPDWLRYGASALVIAGALAVHLSVGKTVHMLATPLGGSRLHAFYSMGPVWLRYLGLTLFPWQLSIEHVVEPRSSFDLLSLAGYGGVLAWLVFGVLAYRRGRSVALLSFVWFFAPLVPVSQVLAPLQNRMADRYLWLSVMALALLVGALCESLAGPGKRLENVVKGALVLLCLALLGASFDRAVTFSDSLLLFADGARKTELGTRSPYQLGIAFEEVGQSDDAIVAYQEVLKRSPEGKVEDARRATNNLARLLARKGDLEAAERVLRKGLTRFADDPKMRGNLAKILAGTGREQEAQSFRAPPH